MLSLLFLFCIQFTHFLKIKEIPSLLLLFEEVGRYFLFWNIQNFGSFVDFLLLPPVFIINFPRQRIVANTECFCKFSFAAENFLYLPTQLTIFELHLPSLLFIILCKHFTVNNNKMSIFIIF